MVPFSRKMSPKENTDRIPSCFSCLPSCFVAPPDHNDSMVSRAQKAASFSQSNVQKVKKSAAHDSAAVALSVDGMLENKQPVMLELGSCRKEIISRFEIQLKSNQHHHQNLKSGKTEPASIKPDRTGMLGPGVGLAILVSILGVMVVFGPVIAAACLFASFYVLPIVMREAVADPTEERMGANAVDLDSPEYKKRVVLEGLLERNGRRPMISPASKAPGSGRR